MYEEFRCAHEDLKRACYVEYLSVWSRKEYDRSRSSQRGRQFAGFLHATMLHPNRVA